jgi:hypothetical protein
MLPIFRQRAARDGHFSALTGTNDSTNLKRQRDDLKGEAMSMFSDRSPVYDPEELALLGTILDQVVQLLPPDLRTPHDRAVLARNILACAATGERDPDQLRRAALLDSKVAA